jgi:translation initiation factor IF-2
MFINMNVSELARKLKVPIGELRDLLPELGFDIGKRAIKVDDASARKIIESWHSLMKEYNEKKQAAVKPLENEPSSAEAMEGKEVKEVKIPAVITVRDFAHRLGTPVTKIQEELMKNGILASLNERIDFETAYIVAEDLKFKVIKEEGGEEQQKIGEKLKGLLEEKDKEKLEIRPPVVVVMGHVDHGKTKLLDAIRKTNIMEGEAGGITQHIGAYQAVKNNKLITFIDTPGHEAFTAMRSRGAGVADIAILVVAADDGVQPQTLEAIKIIEQAKLPYIVAINKIDKPEANIDKVKQELAKVNLLPEDWGGKTICAPISAKQNIGIDSLLEMILLVADMEKERIKANPKREAVGTVIEARVDKGEGPVVTLLVQTGTLRTGDHLVIDNLVYGKVKAMKNYKNEIVKEALPSTPVRIIGFKILPQMGDIAEAKQDVKGLEAKRRPHRLTDEQPVAAAITEEQKEGEETKSVNIILKADVFGSIEAIHESLEKIEHPEVRVNIISQGLGNISDSDVTKAESGQAVIMGFHVSVPTAVEQLAREKKVDVLVYKIIYELIDEVKSRIEKLLAPDVTRINLGRLQILAIFRTEPKHMVVGGKVLDGKIEPGVKVDVIRKKVKVGEGKVEALQLAKQPITEAFEGQECGAKFTGKVKIEEGDILEFYREETKARKLE